MDFRASDSPAVDFIDLTTALCAFKSGIVDDGNEALFARTAEEVPLRLFRFRSGDEHNGWVVPDRWTVEKAEILKDGKPVYDGTGHPLGVAYYSRSFQGRLRLEELRRHLFANPELPDAHIWHSGWTYQPWNESWGLTPPQSLIDGLDAGDYDVDLVTRFEPGEMLAGDCHLAGDQPATIVFQANNCHPHMANDGFASLAVLIRLFQWLAERERQFSYRLVVCPEHIGTVHYLKALDETELETFACGVFAEVMGTDGPVKVASTFWGDHYIDAVFDHACRRRAERYVRVPFRQSVGNDETVWEAPGHEVPFIQLNRAEKFGFPFRGYHSSMDTPNLVQHDRLLECFEVLKAAVMTIEGNVVPKRKFKGLIAFSNPKYGLYVPRIDPSISDGSRTYDSEKWGYFQDCVVRYLDGDMCALEMAVRHDLDVFDVIDYLTRMADKGLVELEPRHFSKRTKAVFPEIELTWLTDGT